ncbi:MAG: HNH endonuclease [Erysipelotrichaceae bacterium]|nr:HNH endonuclease [Erysipelotrichaceae bacterium]
MNKIKQFYSSAAWQKCREAYKKEHNYLCEECQKRGMITPAEEVHHIKKLTKYNIDNPDITLNPKNLQCLCRSCHEAKHKRKPITRYTIDEYGRVFPKDGL